MKLLKIIVVMLVTCLAVTANAVNQEVKVDVLMSKITTLLKDGRAADALPYMAELEGMESSLAKPLPESFHFYYVETLDKAGDKAKALSRAETYAEKYGKKGKYYGQVVEIMSRLQIEADIAAEKEKNRRAAIGLIPDNDVVRDTHTGLMWARNGNILEKMDLSDAMTRVKMLDIGGYRDWRLPTREEYNYLLKRVKGMPWSWFNANGFNNVKRKGDYCSSTIASCYDNTKCVWRTYVEYEEHLYIGPMSGCDIWPVRDGK